MLNVYINIAARIFWCQLDALFCSFLKPIVKYFPNEYINFTGDMSMLAIFCNWGSHTSLLSHVRGWCKRKVTRAYQIPSTFVLPYDMQIFLSLTSASTSSPISSRILASSGLPSYFQKWEAFSRQELVMLVEHQLSSTASIFPRPTIHFMWDLVVSYNNHHLPNSWSIGHIC